MPECASKKIANRDSRSVGTRGMVTLILVPAEGVVPITDQTVSGGQSGIGHKTSKINTFDTDCDLVSAVDDGGNELHRAGVEPATFGSVGRDDGSPSRDIAICYDDSSYAYHPAYAFPTPGPDLQAVIAAWPLLPGPIRTGILAMIRATVPT